MQRSCTELKLIDPKRNRPVSAQQRWRAQGGVRGARLGVGLHAGFGGGCAGPQIRQAQPPGAQRTLDRGLGP
jgi:hypothetical protein